MPGIRRTKLQLATDKDLKLKSDLPLIACWLMLFFFAGLGFRVKALGFRDEKIHGPGRASGLVSPPNPLKVTTRGYG